MQERTGTLTRLKPGRTPDKVKNPRPAILVATMLGIAGGIVLGVRPWRAYLDEREGVAESRLELRTAREERARLERAAAASRSSVGKETTAREAGYGRKDETDLTP